MKKSKKVKLSKIKSPKSIELQYYKELKTLVNKLKSDIREEIMPLISPTKKSINDGAFDLIQKISNLIAKYSGLEMFAERLSSEVTSKINSFNRNKFYRNVHSRLGVDLGAIIKEDKISEVLKLQQAKNRTLIRSIPQEFLKNVEIAIQNGISNGLSNRDITKQIIGEKSEFKKLDKRIKTIVRNEVSSINSTIHKARMKEAGIKKAIWQSSNDERTRSSHKSLHNKEFDIAKGVKDPSSGKMIFPSSEINCRCIAIPIFED